MDARLTTISRLVSFISIVCFLLPFWATAQAVNEGQILSRLNDIIRDKTAAYDLQINKLDTLIANANALRADAAENAVLAYKLLLASKQGEYEPVKAFAQSVVQVATRQQDYRSQGFALRALLAYQAEISPGDTLSTKQQLMALLSRRLSDSDKASVLYDVGLADSKTGNVMSALDFLDQAQQAFWQLANYQNWRDVIEIQIALLMDMQWYSKALAKSKQLVDFLQSQSGNMPFTLTDNMLSVMAAESRWDEIEAVAMRMLEAGVEANNMQAQFNAGFWLLHVNLQRQQMDLVTRWMIKLDDWLAEFPQLTPRTLFTLDKITYLIETGELTAAIQLQNGITVSTLQSENDAYLTIRQHLLNQVALSVAQNDINGTTQAYEALLNWIDEERNRVLSLTMEQISDDFASLQQSSQREIASLSQSLAMQKESVGREATFNNMLIGIVCLLTLIIAGLGYFYVRLKNQKQSSRRRRRSS
ncbi:M81 family metallopeptidase [Aestuariibacter sp. GS-14]|uniref:M81 family metallopeptidase n=1 Tax=Aestuariibacter sp. GS-14 TaxID=2590670 RepID=UPI00112A0FF5|nr:M81 family metallopeptidase [Aestuariibacter sp. GS-14]TPV61711.1 M81 family metallopeptidase [Aestuariibacter sp. GS-14]